LTSHWQKQKKNDTLQPQVKVMDASQKGRNVKLQQYNIFFERKNNNTISLAILSSL